MRGVWCRDASAPGGGLVEEPFDLHSDRGRLLGVPLAWFPRLCGAPAGALQRYELTAGGIHWEALDEDIPVSGLLAGRGDRTRRETGAAAA